MEVSDKINAMTLSSIYVLQCAYKSAIHSTFNEYA